MLGGELLQVVRRDDQVADRKDCAQAKPSGFGCFDAVRLLGRPVEPQPAHLQLFVLSQPGPHESEYDVSEFAVRSWRFAVRRPEPETLRAASSTAYRRSP